MQADDDFPAGLPRGVAIAWGVKANPQRGPKRELSIERIVDAAMAIADAEGLGAVSMSRVASDLGFTTMSLYRYVTAKEDLLLIMQDEGIGVPTLDFAEAAGWRQNLLLWWNGNRGIYRAHPWLLDIPITGAPVTPNNLAWLDAGIEALAESPLSSGERVATMIMLSGMARWQGGIERGYEISIREQNLSVREVEQREDALMRSFVTESAFPSLHRAVVDGVFGAEGEDPFAFAIQRALDGVAAYIDALPNRDATEQAPVTDADDDYPRDRTLREASKARREAHSRLREAEKRESDLIAKARERARKAAEAEAKARAKS
ncbi:TetR/AcrR family transcriptional regulator [Glaciibacter superstes]|uniref:TetR/AcrR family transcriptional regulator n=1 Tax=Glaciibacter superstes TaxID=501023 RepID=UPI0003B40BF2|nr:helix-turn-helix domain-containing protein [Glaciibacter superstes]